MHFKEQTVIIKSGQKTIISELNLNIYNKGSGCEWEGVAE